MTDKEKELRRSLLITEIQLLTRQMSETFVAWRNGCGKGGWYDMPEENIRKFFGEWLVVMATTAAKLYKTD